MGSAADVAPQVYALPPKARISNPNARRGIGLIAVGLVLLVLGAYALSTSNVSHDYSSTFNVLAGRYIKISANMKAGTWITGSFRETSGRPVTFQIMSSVQLASYQVGQNIGNLYDIVDVTSGTISFTCTAADTYYLVFTHGTGLLNTTETVSFQRSYHSPDTFLLVVVGVLGVVGPLNIYWGTRLRRERRAPGPSP